MSIKFSISTIAIAAVLTLTHAAIATAEVYKTSKGQVVVTGLTAKQKYPIKGTNAKNKPVTRKDIAANTCGEALVNGAGKYKSWLLVQRRSILLLYLLENTLSASPKRLRQLPRKRVQQ